ncbi:MAG: hypothetical protein AAFP19_12795 [Bacteroidota bacterium]
MKKIAISTLLLLCFLCHLSAQKSVVDIKQKLSFKQLKTSSVLYLENINGSIEVQGYEGTEIILVAQKTIKAKRQKNVDFGMEELQIKSEERSDTLFVGMDIPCKDPQTGRIYRNGRLFGDWTNCFWDPKYDFQLDYKVKVPRQLNLVLSTINRGDITVKQVDGRLSVCNINGEISLIDIKGATHVRAINGDIELRYTQNPQQASQYFSHNGNIRAYFQDGLSATMLFKSYQGEFYTDIEEIEVKENKISEKRELEDDELFIRLEGKTEIKARSGDVVLDFETFNGDIYVREN